MIPTLDSDTKLLPQYSQPVGDNYVFLQPRDSCARPVLPTEVIVIKAFFQEAGGEYVNRHQGPDRRCENKATWKPMVQQWGHICLPNGQVTRSLWKELHKVLVKVRMARNVKVTLLNPGIFSRALTMYSGVLQRLDTFC